MYLIFSQQWFVGLFVFFLPGFLLFSSKGLTLFFSKSFFLHTKYTIQGLKDRPKTNKTRPQKKNHKRKLIAGFLMSKAEQNGTCYIELLYIYIYICICNIFLLCIPYRERVTIVCH